MEYNMKILYLLLTVSFSICEPPSYKKPLIFPTWSSKSNLLNKKQNGISNRNTPGTLVIQIRSDSAMPSLVLKQRTPYHHHPLPHHFQSLTHHNIRPLKMAATPHFVIKSAPLISKLARKSKPKTITKTKLSSVKPPQDYVYEKPFSSAAAADIHRPSSVNTAHLTHAHFGPIHTIPAPNLGIYSPFTYDMPDNHINHQNLHTYQVTEEPTNDQTIHDPISGQQKLFAPDPDPSLPTAKIQPSLDPFSMPSNGKPLPSDLQSNYVPQIHFVNPAIDQYQPQFHQFYSLQTAASNKIPLSVYNPTYLVTQSNNLYNHHQQQLFKPNSNYAGSSNQLISDPVNEIASVGQILEAARDPANQIHPQYSGIKDGSSSNNPTFAALVASQSDNHVTESPLDAQGGFIVSNYFDNNQNPQSYQNYIESTQRQRENDRNLAQAHLDLHNQLIVHNAQQYAYDDQTIQPQTEPTNVNVHVEHQKLLKEHFGSSPLRIFVPDDDYQGDSNQIFKKRSDDYSEESSTSIEPKVEFTEDYGIFEDSQELSKSSRK